jgi:hypothetical protein
MIKAYLKNDDKFKIYYGFFDVKEVVAKIIRIKLFTSEFTFYFHIRFSLLFKY